MWSGGVLDSLTDGVAVIRFVRAASHLVSWIAVVILSSGCTRYLVVPSNGVSPEPWSQVRVHLKVPTEYPAGRLTVGDAATLVGGIMEQNDSEVVLSLYSVHSVSGAHHPAEGETVNIPVDNLQGMEVKRLAPVPTVGLIGVIALTAVFVPVAVFGGSNAPSGGDPTDPNPTFPRRSR